MLEIPVPHVLNWDATADNPIGSEYMIMEEATGSQVDSVWDEMAPTSKLKIMREVVAIEKKLSSISFSQ